MRRCLLPVCASLSQVAGEIVSLKTHLTRTYTIAARLRTPTTNHATCLPCPARPFSTGFPRRPRRCVALKRASPAPTRDGTPPNRDSTRFLPLLLDRHERTCRPLLTRYPSPMSPLARQATRPVAKRAAVKIQVRPDARARLPRVRVRRRSAMKREETWKQQRDAPAVRRLTSRTDSPRSTRIIHRRPSRATHRMRPPCP